MAWGLGFLLVLSPGCRRREESSQSAPGPRDANVLLITLDTTRADHLSCYSTPARSGHVTTPQLDALAGRGVMFSHATAQVPLTAPSHASIMTGAYPTVHGLRDMDGFVLDPSHPTVASITSANGFATAAFVGARVLAKNFGLDRGFAVYDDEIGSQMDEDNVSGVFAERRASVVTDRALEWLRANGQKKFFLWAHYYDPHAPYDPPEPYKHLYAQDRYSGEIAYMDEQVGRLLNGLAQMGVESRTLIAVIGDHGESLGEHGEATHGVFLYDSTLHVPFILAGPRVPNGKVVTNQVRSIDVMPTLLSFLGLPQGAEAQGANLWPLMERSAGAGSTYSYGETLYPRIYMGWSELRAMRTGSWKFIAAPHPELYNLERDPGETHNLISEAPAEAEQLQKKVWEVAGEQRRQEKVVTKPVDRKTLRALESLGYLGAGSSQRLQLGTPAPDPKDRLEALQILSQVEDSLGAKDYKGAARLMERGYRLDPANPRAHMYLATAYEQTGQYRRAIQVFEHGLAMKIETDRIYSRMGIDYLHLQLIPKAIEAMEHAARLNPADVNNLRNLGMTYLQIDRLDDAEKTFKAITAQTDRYAAAHDGLGVIAAQRGDTEGARREFEKALAVNPDDVKSLLDLGILYQQTGNRDQALHYLQLFLKRAPRGQFADQIPAVREAIQELQNDKPRATH